MQPRSTLYRRKRSRLWLLYLAISFLIFCALGNSPEGDGQMILTALPILAFFPVIIYTCVLTHRARVWDRTEFLQEMHRRNLTPSAVNRFLTDKCLKGAENGWAEDVLFGLFGIPSVLMIGGILIFERDTPLVVRVMLTVFGFGTVYILIYLIMNRKKQRKLANLYALLFAAAMRPEYTWPELASSVSRANAGLEVSRLVDRNYMMNLEAEPREQLVRIIGFSKVPKNAYVCSNCGGASSIPVGAAKICYYCGRPLQK